MKCTCSASTQRKPVESYRTSCHPAGQSRASWSFIFNTARLQFPSPHLASNKEHQAQIFRPIIQFWHAQYLIQKDLYSFGNYYEHFRDTLMTSYTNCSYSKRRTLQTLEQGIAYTWLVNCSREWITTVPGRKEIFSHGSFLCLFVTYIETHWLGELQQVVKVCRL